MKPVSKAEGVPSPEQPPMKAASSKIQGLFKPQSITPTRRHTAKVVPGEAKIQQLWQKRQKAA